MITIAKQGPPMLVELNKKSKWLKNFKHVALNIFGLSVSCLVTQMVPRRSGGSTTDFGMVYCVLSI